MDKNLINLMELEYIKCEDYNSSWKLNRSILELRLLKLIDK